MPPSKKRIRISKKRYKRKRLKKRRQKGGMGSNPNGTVTGKACSIM